jgi:hypothetical protein
MQKSRLRRRALIAVTLAVFAAAAWTGSAVGAPVFRSVTFEQTYSFDNSPFCGDAVIVVHDVGRITFTVFLNQDGTPQAFATHDAAITSTITNTETGVSITFFYSNFVNEQIRTDPRTGVITDTLSFTGLNFIIRSPDGPPLVAAGRAELTATVTFDADGNPIFTQTGSSETPNMVHLTQVLCA